MSLTGAYHSQPAVICTAICGGQAQPSRLAGRRRMSHGPQFFVRARDSPHCAIYGASACKLHQGRCLDCVKRGTTTHAGWAYAPLGLVSKSRSSRTEPRRRTTHVTVAWVAAIQTAQCSDFSNTRPAPSSLSPEQLRPEALQDDRLRQHMYCRCLRGLRAMTRHGRGTVYGKRLP